MTQRKVQYPFLMENEELLRNSLIVEFIRSWILTVQNRGSFFSCLLSLVDPHDLSLRRKVFITTGVCHG